MDPFGGGFECTKRKFEGIASHTWVEKWGYPGLRTSYELRAISALIYPADGT